MKLATLLVFLVTTFLGFFHIVGTGGAFTVIPKSAFTFANTFTTVTEVIDRYNKQTIAESLRGDPQLDNIVRALTTQGHIVSGKKTKSLQTEQPSKGSACSIPGFSLDQSSPVKIDYTNVKLALLDSKNAVGKTVQLVAEYRELALQDECPVMTVWVKERASTNIWQVKFDNSLNSTVNSLKEGQLLSIACKIRELSNFVSSCSLLQLVPNPETRSASTTPAKATDTSIFTIFDRRPIDLDTLSLEAVKKTVGKHPYDMLEIHTVAAQLRVSLGNKYSELENRMGGPGSVIKKQGDYYFGSACMAHNCGGNEGAIAIHTLTGAVVIGFQNGKNIEVFGVVDESTSPSPIRDWIGLLKSNDKSE